MPHNTHPEGTELGFEPGRAWPLKWAPSPFPTSPTGLGEVQASGLNHKWMGSAKQFLGFPLDPVDPQTPKSHPWIWLLN